MGESEAVELIADKCGQHDDHQWVRPKFVPQQRYDEHEFDCSVREQIHRSEMFSATDETLISTDQVCGYEVPGIFGEFFMQNGQQECCGSCVLRCGKPLSFSTFPADR